nr:TIR domain-containing protein [uncultured Methanoregula sp.]
MRQPKIFISHSWEYKTDYENLINLLKNRGYFDFLDYSIPENDPIEGSNKDVWIQLESQIKYASIVILIVGTYASYSGSIKKEIEIARNYSKPILAIVPRGAERTSSLKNYANDVVGWNTESIVQAIRNLTQ